MFNRLLVFLLIFTGVSILAAIMAGGGGIVSTTLAENITANSTYIPTSGSTNLFANKDIIMINNEEILYTSKNSSGFNVYNRGYGDTDAAEHDAGSVIYTKEAGVINNALGFNVGVEIETGGTFGVVTLPIKFFTTTLPNLIELNANFLKIPELSIIAIIWFIAGIALLVTLAIQIAPIAISIATGLVGLIRR